MTIYQKILNATPTIDKKYTHSDYNDILHYVTVCAVPRNNQHRVDISTYTVQSTATSSIPYDEGDIIIIDKIITAAEYLHNVPTSSIVAVVAEEKTAKDVQFGDNLAKTISLQKPKRIIAVGGGIILNLSAYVAEKLSCDLIAIPTTILSMSDVCVGGKVRMNNTEKAKKHYYATYYEANDVLLLPDFLRSIPEKNKAVNIAEIIKHAAFQSPLMAEYILSSSFNLQNNKDLFKVIRWTLDLKVLCLQLDYYEDIDTDGSCRILKAGHAIADRIEEKSKFQIGHDQAILYGMYREAQNRKDTRALSILNKLYKKFDLNSYKELPFTVETSNFGSSNE